MGILKKIGELIYNFTHQIEDNSIIEDMPQQQFVKLATESGMSQEDINAMLSTRDGLLVDENINKKPKKVSINNEKAQNKEKIIVDRTNKREQDGLDR